jgi:Rrf2 family protein
VIPRGGVVALRALLAMVEQPERWRSGAELAAEQGLPAPFLEQLLLRLRRAGVLEARRGRHGGYRLHRPPSDLSLAAVLAAVEAHPAAVASDSPAAADDATGRVTDALQHRLRRAMERELQRLNLEDLHHDLRSSRAALGAEGGLLLG